jgi:transcriptional regulator with XRE-family HTH domain
MTNEVDAIVGRRIRALRSARGLTQAELGHLVGVRFQQIQKYENGSNRVSAARLLAIAGSLDVPISHFVEGIDLGQARAGAAADLHPHLHDEEVLSLAQDLARLTTHERQAIRSLVRSLRDAAPARGGEG